MITLTDYFQSHDDQPQRDLRLEYPTHITHEIEVNADRWVTIVNALAAHIGFHLDGLNSGWRPPPYNAKTRGAARFSRHMTGEAGDVTDHEGVLDEILLTDWEAHRAEPGPTSLLSRFGLWMEHPAHTKGWCHLQLTPQASFKVTGNRIFHP